MNDMIDLGAAEVIEPVIAYLLHCVRHHGQAFPDTRIWLWLFVHGLQEGCSFELAIGNAPANPETLLQTEFWEHCTESNNEPDTVGEYELAGIFEGYNPAVQRPWVEHPALRFQDWTLRPVGEYEWDCQGFTADGDDEAENLFITRVYRHILKQTAERCDEIEGFVLEMHDSALPKQWISAKATSKP